MFQHRYRYFFVLALSVYTYISTVICDVYYYFHIHIEWYVALATIAAITLLTWECSRWVQSFYSNKFVQHHKKIKYLLSFFSAGCALTTITTVAVVLAVGMVWHRHSLNETIIPLKLNLIYAWLVNLLFHLIHAISFYLEQYKTKWMEAEELKRITAQAELTLIKSQINPHFLFNNLNVLSTLVMKNNEEANKFIEEFSKVYRYILSANQKELVSLKEELEFIEPYIFLLQQRFRDGLQVVINVPESFNNRYIIPASLQLLIENAIKHNVVSRNKPLHIDVWVNGQNDIVVENNLQQKNNVENSTQIGLKNIDKRYALVSGQKVAVEKTDSIFRVSIPLLHLN